MEDRAVDQRRSEFEQIMDRLGDRAGREPLVIDDQADREIRDLVRSVAAGPDCLLCAVRQLTEGDGPLARLEPEGETVSGVVLKIEPVHPYSIAGGMEGRAVTLWTGGMDRVRVVSYSGMFRNRLEAAAPHVGDRLTITRLADAQVERGQFRGRRFSDWSFEVERGHHS